MHLRQKLSIREIARLTGVSRNTVTKHLAANTIEFALNNPHVLDFALRNRSFSSLREQGFVCLWLKPCNFGPAHEAPSTP
jgi:DNA-binding transcriptional ArsR family regulator